ncbi:MAG TPA: epoxide hydrolase [Thermoanaerobaculia bacterium]|nr:epoxide hydrolase [Thermoanaerobaculia bacterium]
MRLEPLRIHVEETVLEDLRERIARTRWPDQPEGDASAPGMAVADLRELLEYWQHRFDWRVWEDRINAWPNYRARVGGDDPLEIHFIHARGSGPSPFPLIFTHGWPGSFLECLKLLPLLTDPGRHGADPSDAFDVIVPSLPGYGFSQRPPRGGTTPRRIGALWAELMEGLGYARFGAQGGDWGASVSTWLARDFRERLAGLHLNYIPGSYTPHVAPGSETEEERQFLRERDRWREESGAYGHVQATRPQTLAFALEDSPAGLAAWIVEKFREWSDGRKEPPLTPDELLANVTLYWVTGTIGSSMRLYCEGRRTPLVFKAGERVHVPCGIARFALEAPMPPRSWVERGYDVVRWTDLPRGGHFAAMEQPELLARDVRDFFRPLRKSRA